MSNTICSRCGFALLAAEAESCWYCVEDLCFDCWEVYGHCGHAEAEEVNKQAQAGIFNPRPLSTYGPAHVKTRQVTP